MEDFFKNLVRGISITPPENISNSLYQQFENPLNVEWYLRKDIYEAIFYKDNVEHIARIGNDGKMIDYRINLPLLKLPLPVKASAQSKGEIMNVVSIIDGNEINYEVIIRDKQLTRYVLLFKGDGKILKEKLL